MEILILGFIAFLAFALVMLKMGIGKWVRLGWKADLIISLFLGFIFVGTFTGMAVGLVAGIFISMFLSFCRLFSTTGKKTNG
jgi:hypothetical protein